MHAAGSLPDLEGDCLAEPGVRHAAKIEVFIWVTVYEWLAYFAGIYLDLPSTLHVTSNGTVYPYLKGTRRVLVSKTCFCGSGPKPKTKPFVSSLAGRSQHVSARG